MATPPPFDEIDGEEKSKNLNIYQYKINTKSITSF